MLVDIVSDDDDSEESEYINDPVLLRYIYKLDEMAYELADETEGYPLSQDQIEQLLRILFILHKTLQRVEDLAILDSLLRITFAHDYYKPDTSMIGALTEFSLSGEN